MAHPQQMDFVKRIKEQYPRYFADKKVIEFGSLNLNGTVRDFFEGCDYTGVDIVEGEGVDVVSLCHEYDQDVVADVVVSCEMLEHDQYWMMSLNKMYSMVKSGGAIIITCATLGRKEHGTTHHSPADSPATNSWYMNLNMDNIANTFAVELMKNKFSVFHMEVNDESHDLYFFAIKK